MKNPFKLILVLLILFLIILMEIIVKIKSNKRSSVIKTTPTPIIQTQNGEQNYNETDSQPTTREGLEEETVTNETGTTLPIDNEVGPTLTDQQAREGIRINQETGGFHDFIAPEDMLINEGEQ